MNLHQEVMNKPGQAQRPPVCKRKPASRACFSALGGFFLSILILICGAGCSTTQYSDGLRPYRVTALLPLSTDLPIGTAFSFARMPADIYDDIALGSTEAFPVDVTNGFRTNQVYFPDVELFSTNDVGVQVGYQSLAAFGASLKSVANVTLKVRGAFSVTVPESRVLETLTVVTNLPVVTKCGTNLVPHVVLKPEVRDTIARMRQVTARNGIKSVFTGNATYYNHSHTIFRVATEVFYATNLVFTVKPKQDVALGLDPSLLQRFFSGASLNCHVTNGFQGSYVVETASPTPLAFGYRGPLLRVNLQLPQPVPVPFQVDRIIEDR